MAEPKKQVPLRLNAKLYDALAAWAEDDFRSVNGQIEYLLTECVRQRKKNGKYVALENINDPANLGAISRTAEALGADGLILSSGSCDPYSPKALRASMGTLLRMPIFVFGDFAAEMKSCGLKFYACVPSAADESISNVKFLPGCAVMIGNEANGLTEETKAAAHKKITVPMRGRAESLNAAAAAAIAVWEMMK